MLNSLIIKEMCLRDPEIIVARGFVVHSLNTADRICYYYYYYYYYIKEWN